MCVRVCTLSHPDSQASLRRFTVCSAGSLNVLGGVTGTGHINGLNSSNKESRWTCVFSVLLLSLMCCVQTQNGDLEASLDIWSGDRRIVFEIKIVSLKLNNTLPHCTYFIIL